MENVRFKNAQNIPQVVNQNEIRRINGANYHPFFGGTDNVIQQEVRDPDFSKLLGAKQGTLDYLFVNLDGPLSTVYRLTESDERKLFNPGGV